MSWDFHAISSQGGKTVLSDLSPDQINRIPDYIGALRIAEQTSVPHPIFSGFYVNSSALMGSTYAEGGNIEYGFCQALHSEESLVAAVRSIHGRQRGMPIIGFSSLGIEPTCCGNCRDILFDEFGEGEIVSGAPSGGTASVATFDDIKFDDFRKVDMSPELCEMASETHRKGRELVKDAYSGSQRPERNYSVGILTRDGFYVGAHDIGCDYHPLYAGRDAMRQARRARDPFVKNIVVVSEKKPHLMYKDRQCLLELNVGGEMLSGIDNNPPVSLVSFEDGVMHAWEAILKEMMPFPFIVTAFGDDFIESYRAWCKQAYEIS